MKFFANANDLYNQVSKVRTAITSRSAVPIMKCVKIIATDNTLYICGTSRECGVTVKFEGVEVDQGGQVCVPCDKFYSLLKEIGDNKLSFESDNHKAKLQDHQGSYEIATRPGEDFPEINKPDNTADVSVNSDSLISSFDKISFSVADDLDKYALAGVFLSVNDDCLEVVGADGGRLSKSLITDFNCPEKCSAVISKDLFSLIKKVCDDEEIELKVAENIVLFESENGRGFARQIEGTYPKYQQFIPDDDGVEIVVNKEEFESSLKKAGILSEDDIPKIKMEFDGSGITIKSSSKEYGKSEISIPADYSSEIEDTAFNPNYLLDVCNVIEKDIFKFRAKTNKDGVRIEEEKELYVVMPIEL